jgi:hypothetical protein
MIQGDLDDLITELLAFDRNERLKSAEGELN